jgi:hypothetical protein
VLLGFTADKAPLLIEFTDKLHISMGDDVIRFGASFLKYE